MVDLPRTHLGGVFATKRRRGALATSHGPELRRLPVGVGLSIAFLLGSPADIAAVLRRRRTEFGISYIGVSALFMEQFAPVIRLLREPAA